MMSVTEIVGSVYKYEGDNFQKSLLYPSLSQKELVYNSIAYNSMNLLSPKVMDVLNLYGSFVHRMAKQLSLGEDVLIDERHISPIKEGLKSFFKAYSLRPILNEWTFQLPGEYSGTLDMFCEIEWKGVPRLCVLDFKTYGLYKNIYGIQQSDRNSTLSSNTKKVSLQLSLYTNALQQLHPELFEGRYPLLLLVWVTPEEIIPYEVDFDLRPYQYWKRRQW